ncbi:MAG: hypothetical protein KKG04_10540 [Candidatus Thermoplasmatota archaeon]|nr:hypothetical protein [Candidatus Thermoplasmatota archaeon]MBU1864289.1 hypothetical protein [Candidatus Omnitrophota bacterium]
MENEFQKTNSTSFEDNLVEHSEKFYRGKIGFVIALLTSLIIVAALSFFDVHILSRIVPHPHSSNNYLNYAKKITSIILFFAIFAFFGGSIGRILDRKKKKELGVVFLKKSFIHSLGADFRRLPIKQQLGFVIGLLGGYIFALFLYLIHFIPVFYFNIGNILASGKVSEIFFGTILLILLIVRTIIPAFFGSWIGGILDQKRYIILKLLIVSLLFIFIMGSIIILNLFFFSG